MKRAGLAALIATACASVTPAPVEPHPEEPRARPAPASRDCVPTAEAEAVGAMLVDRTELTQAQWRDLTGTQPSLFEDCPDCPVERVSVADVAAALNRRSMRAGLTPCYRIDRGTCFRDTVGCVQERPFCEAPCAAVVTLSGPPDACGFRLPTRAEWDAIAREAGVGLEATRSNGRTRPVDRSATGLDAVIGNVWEWLEPDSTGGLIAGGGWSTSPEDGVSFGVRATDIRLRSSNIGFRAVRSCGPDAAGANR